MSRFNRGFNCYFDGLQEEKYFKHISKKLTEYDREITVKFNKIKKLPTLEKQSSDLKKVAFFDYDRNRVEFERKVLTCKKTKPYYENLNFDLWLLLHKQQYSCCVTNNDDYVGAVRAAYNLPINADIKTENNIDKILNQIELSDIEFAINNAKEIMAGKDERDRRYVNKFFYYDNPSMNIHEFIDELLKEVKKSRGIDKFD